MEPVLGAPFFRLAFQAEYISLGIILGNVIAFGVSLFKVRITVFYFDLGL